MGLPKYISDISDEWHRMHTLGRGGISFQWRGQIKGDYLEAPMRKNDRVLVLKKKCTKKLHFTNKAKMKNY